MEMHKGGRRGAGKGISMCSVPCAPCSRLWGHTRAEQAANCRGRDRGQAAVRLEVTQDRLLCVTDWR